MSRTPQALFSLLQDKFNLSELHQLAFKLNIKPENLPGSTLGDFARSLVEHAERHALYGQLNTLVDEELRLRQERADEVDLVQLAGGNGRTAVWLAALVVVVLAVIAGLLFWPEDPAGDEIAPTERILLQVQVVSSENQVAVPNARVSLDYAKALFPQERTDSTGLAVFELPPTAEGAVARITVEANDRVETQTMTVNAGMRAVVFQLDP